MGPRLQWRMWQPHDARPKPWYHLMKPVRNLTYFGQKLTLDQTNKKIKSSFPLDHHLGVSNKKCSSWKSTVSTVNTNQKRRNGMKTMKWSTAPLMLIVHHWEKQPQHPALSHGCARPWGVFFASNFADLVAHCDQWISVSQADQMQRSVSCSRNVMIYYSTTEGGYYWGCLW